MRQIAIITDADQSRLVQYETENGYHRFYLGNTPTYVKANPAVRPTVLNGLGDLVPMDRVPRFMRKSVLQKYGEVYREGISLRYFQAIARGYVELPTSHVLHAWTRFLEEATDVAVATNDQNAHPRVNDGIMVPMQREQHSNGMVTLKDQAPKVEVLSSLSLMHVDLVRMGLHPSQVAHFLRFLVETQRAGHAGHFLTPEIAKWYAPSSENPLLLIPVALYGIYLGLELGTHTAVGDFYKGVGQQWIILILAVPILAFFIWSKVRSNGRST